MPPETVGIEAHPEGERKWCGLETPPAWPVDTPGGRYYAEVELDAPSTREGQLIFVAQFLHAGGRWKRLLEQCPLQYVGNRGSGAVNVVGTAVMSILCGHWRYAHINALRFDAVAEADGGQPQADRIEPGPFHHDVGERLIASAQQRKREHGEGQRRKDRECAARQGVLHAS